MARFYKLFFIFLVLTTGCVSNIDVIDSDFQTAESHASELLYLDAPQSDEEPTTPETSEPPTDPDTPEEPEVPEDETEEPEDPVVPEPGTESCVQWQDCGPHFGDQNSLYECVNNTCTCDPSGVSEGTVQMLVAISLLKNVFGTTDVAPPRTYRIR